MIVVREPVWKRVFASGRVNFFDHRLKDNDFAGMVPAAAAGGIFIGIEWEVISQLYPCVLPVVGWAPGNESTAAAKTSHAPLFDRNTRSSFANFLAD